MLFVRYTPFTFGSSRTWISSGHSVCCSTDYSRWLIWSVNNLFQTYPLSTRRAVVVNGEDRHSTLFFCTRTSANLLPLLWLKSPRAKKSPPFYHCERDGESESIRMETIQTSARFFRSVESWSGGESLSFLHCTAKNSAPLVHRVNACEKSATLSPDLFDTHADTYGRPTSTNRSIPHTLPLCQ